MDLANEFKQKILSSKQLLEKCKHFQKFEKRYLDKGLEDFSSHVVDSIDLDLCIEDGIYTVSSIQSDEEMESYTYFNLIKAVLDKLSYNLDLRNYLTSLKVDVIYQIVCWFKFDIKYFHDQNEFVLKSIESCEIFKSLIPQKDRFEILAIEENIAPLRQKEIILGYSKSEDNAKNIISLLNEEKIYLFDLDKKIKEDLFDISQIIRNPTILKSTSLFEKIEDEIDVKLNNLFRQHNEDVKNQTHLLKLNKLLNIQYASYEDILNLNMIDIIHIWLDKFCKKQIRSLIDYNKYNHYFSSTGKWLNFIWFLENDVIINFVKV